MMDILIIELRRHSIHYEKLANRHHRKCSKFNLLNYVIDKYISKYMPYV